MKWFLPAPDYSRPFVAFVLLALLSFVGACSTSAPSSDFHYFSEPMTAYLQSDLSTAGDAEPLVHITVPLRHLVFFQNEGVISGGIEVVVIAWEGPKQVGGAVATEMINIRNWADSHSDSLLVLDVKVPLETSSKVELEVTARSLGTTRTWNQRIAWDPEQWHQFPLVFKHWNWNADDNGSLAADEDSLRVELITSRIFGQDARDQNIFVELQILGEDDFVLKARQKVVFFDTLQTTQIHQLSIAADKLPFGRYQALARLAAESDSEKEHISNWYPARDLLATRIHFADDQAWKEQLDWLNGLFPQEAIAYGRKVSQGERQEYFHKLWSSDQDQNSLLQDHLQSILKADHLFGGVQRGALTDQGRAWIRYGEPDHIENKGNMGGRYRRWQIWRYQHLAMNLTFLDDHGLGMYRLIETGFSED